MNSLRVIGIVAVLFCVAVSGNGCLQGQGGLSGGLGGFLNSNDMVFNLFSDPLDPWTLAAESTAASDSEPPSDGKIAGKNDAGFTVIRHDHTEGGVTVYNYEIYDPVLGKYYPAVGVGNNTVKMSDTGEKLWKEDRKKLPLKERFKGISVPPKTEPTGVSDVGCFFADTKVLMGDGRSLAISKISEGDIVKSYNTETETIESKRVMKTYTFPSEGYYLINGTIKATAKHPFLMTGPGEVWKKASELELGDRVKSPEGQITVDSIEKVAEKGKSYNFRVADNKAYVVSGLDKLYVVHNGL